MPMTKFLIPAYETDDEGRLVLEPGDGPLLSIGTDGQQVYREVYLGRLPKLPGEPAVQLQRFLDLKELTPPPVKADYFTKAMSSIRLTLGNTREGDCVIASGGHGLGTWSGNDTDSGGIILETETEALSEYHRIGGRGDNGLVMSQALDDFVHTGLLAGGKRYKIDGWASFPNKREFLKAVVAIFGGCRVGFNVPATWMNNVQEGFTWDVPVQKRWVGGHDVRIAGYDEKGLRVCTWGLLGWMTYAAFEDSDIVDECYVELSPNWTNADGVAPSNFKVEKLQAALAAVKSGQIPSWIDPPTPTGEVVATPNTGIAPLNVAISTTLPIGAGGYVIDFGDGSVPAPTTLPTTHQYKLPGTYRITVTTAGVTVTTQVVVTGAPTPPVTGWTGALSYTNGLLTAISTGTLSTTEGELKDAGVSPAVIADVLMLIADLKAKKPTSVIVSDFSRLLSDLNTPSNRVE